MNNRKIGWILGAAAVSAGAYGAYRWNFRLPMKEYSRSAMYMAMLDDEICRHALQGMEVAGKPVDLMEPSESLQYRYRLFLKMNRRKSARAIAEDLEDLETQRARQLA